VRRSIFAVNCACFRLPLRQEHHAFPAVPWWRLHVLRRRLARGAQRSA
jgi:fatty acid desaturase